MSFRFESCLLSHSPGNSIQKLTGLFNQRVITVCHNCQSFCLSHDWPAFWPHGFRIEFQSVRSQSFINFNRPSFLEYFRAKSYSFGIFQWRCTWDRGQSNLWSTILSLPGSQLSSPGFSLWSQLSEVTRPHLDSVLLILHMDRTDWIETLSWGSVEQYILKYTHIHIYI
jgi:hypothetical protein